jgi:hypothetical protein
MSRYICTLSSIIPTVTLLATRVSCFCVSTLVYFVGAGHSIAEHDLHALSSVYLCNFLPLSLSFSIFISIYRKSCWEQRLIQTVPSLVQWSYPPSAYCGVVQPCPIPTHLDCYTLSRIETSNESFSAAHTNYRAVQNCFARRALAKHNMSSRSRLYKFERPL